MSTELPATAVPETLDDHRDQPETLELSAAEPAAADAGPRVIIELEEPVSDTGDERRSGAESESDEEPDDESGESAPRAKSAGKKRKVGRRDRVLAPRMRIEIQPTAGPGSPGAVPGSHVMVVNDIPGEECRIAILEKGRLEALFSERATTATNVGNIYKGRVTNVEPAIQAAFVDFGEGQNGFLHISDLHPRYFPGPEKKERMGKKIPRRERPLIQEALRRGSEVLVQVLKQGIGTKGPTLTSYLSIPGRLLVMMPSMDKNGVSRKVEDEEQRRAMRKILDSLNLPEGFGFILRTAGFDRTKAELQRDATYLQRLWSVMEDRIKRCGAPCELYTESDLLIRTIRDVVGPEIGSIVVDSASAFDRVSSFLRVVAPRSAPEVRFYQQTTPVFHAFDIERQIEMIHAREVPLPSGGALVIDQTEALVAIDVNSGRSRSARDSESNAFQTNCEAVDEICRQIRLRDLGGLIINDLIDMRSVKHRKEIEERFVNTLKKDRARTTILPISEFGILEMTRQRMRPSIRKAHYMDCPHCAGHGEIKIPESVASDAIRHIGYLMQFDRIRRVELVCSTKVASVLLGGKRRTLVEMEDAHQKRIDVRISEALSADRIDFYAYDERNADVDLGRLPSLTTPDINALPTAALDTEESLSAPPKSDRRRGRRRQRRGPADATAIALEVGPAPVTDDSFQDELPEVVEKPATEPMRVFELAKELGVASKEVLARCKECPDIDVKNHMSRVSGETVDQLRSLFKPVAEEPEPTDVKPAGRAPEPAKKDDAASSNGDDGGKRRRRRRRRGRDRRDNGQADGAAGTLVASTGATMTSQPHPTETTRPAANSDSASGSGEPSAPISKEPTGQPGSGEGRRRRRRRGRGRNGQGGKDGAPGVPRRAEGSSDAKPASAPAAESKPAPGPAPVRRPLFGTRTRVSAIARAAAKKSDS